MQAHHDVFANLYFQIEESGRFSKVKKLFQSSDLKKKSSL